MFATYAVHVLKNAGGIPWIIAKNARQPVDTVQKNA